MEVPFVDIHSHNKCRSSNITVTSAFLGDNIAEIQKPFSIGIHPWHSDISTSNLELKFSPYLDEIVALGEIGLDRAIKIPISKQTEIFLAQLDIAKKHNLPVMIHCVKAYSDMLAIIPKYKKITYIFHGFYASQQILRCLLPYNTFFSMGIRELQRSKGTTLIRSIPANRLFLETDESGTEIEDVYTLVSKAISIDIKVLREQLYNNYTNLF